jgi:hypothetical protein
VSPGSASPVQEYPVAVPTQLTPELTEHESVDGPVLTVAVAVHPTANAASSEVRGRPTKKAERRRAQGGMDTSNSEDD